MISRILVSIEMSPFSSLWPYRNGSCDGGTRVGGGPVRNAEWLLLSR